MTVESPPSSLRGSPYPSDRRTKLFTLASSQDVRLFGVEIDIVDTPEFQRLAGIRQLGTSNYVFRSALHTRFEHSLGTLHTAQRLLDALEKNPDASHMLPVNPKARRLARLGALLHDLPHMPFGHTLEDEFGLFPRHDKDPVRWDYLFASGGIAAALLAAEGSGDLTDGEIAELHLILTAKDEDDIVNLEFPFVADIVGNTVCADLLDYVVRDLEACGMPVALGDRFLTYFVITEAPAGATERQYDAKRMALRLEKRGMPRPDVESEVIKLLTYRYELAERVYFHHAKNAASVMVGRAVQELGLHEPDPGGTGNTTPAALRMLFASAGETRIPISDDLLLHILAMPDVATALNTPTTTDVVRRGRAARLGVDLLERRLYKVAYLATHAELGHTATAITERFGTPEQRREFEDLLAQQMNLEPGDILVHIPEARMMEKLAAVRVERSDGSITSLDEWDRTRSNRVRSLNDAHRLLWRILVYVRPDGTNHAATLVRRQTLAALCAEQFGTPSLYDLGVSFPVGWTDQPTLPRMSWLQQEVARQVALETGKSAIAMERVAATSLRAGSLPRPRAQGGPRSIDDMRDAWRQAVGRRQRSRRPR
jgi:HD superfamily phosphohydrolase